METLHAMKVDQNRYTANITPYMYTYTCIIIVDYFKSKQRYLSSMSHSLPCSNYPPTVRYPHSEGFGVHHRSIQVADHSKGDVHIETCKGTEVQWVLCIDLGRRHMCMYSCMCMQPCRSCDVQPITPSMSCDVQPITPVCHVMSSLLPLVCHVMCSLLPLYVM